MRWATTAAAVEAAATGLILLLSPVLFGRLIFGADLSEAGPALGRLAGIALVGFALATGAAPAAASQHAARASLIYNLLATIYLGYVGATGHLVGILLWPAAGLHAILLILLAGARLLASKRDYTVRTETGG